MGTKVLFIVAALTMSPALALAVPGSTPACRPPGATSAPVDDENGNDAHHLWIYIENDFNLEMRAKTPSTADDNLTFSQVEHAILQAAEIWNTQSRHISLVYGGPFAGEQADDFCSGTYQRPAVFVRYFEGFDGVSNALASVRSGNPHCDERIMTFWGQDKDTLGWRNFPIGSQGDDFVNIAVHEFGHVVYLGHAHDTVVPTCHSVMAYNDPPCNTDPNDGGRHLKNYEKDCVSAAYTHGRKVKTYVRGLNSSGDFKGLYLLNHGQEKAFIHGPPLRTSTQFRFLWYGDLGSRWTTAGSDGYFAWNSWAGIGAPFGDIFELDEPPTLFGVQDWSWSWTSNGTRVSFLDDENDSNGTMYNPPYIQYVRTDSLLSSSSGDTSFKECDASCSNQASLRSHLPLAAAWDPVSGTTVFGRVNTKSIRGNDGDGRIELYPGFFSSTYYNRLRSGDFVPGGFGGQWPSDASTDQPIGLACGDASWPDTYNCLVAWTNKDQYSGYVQYQYFRVDPSNDIEFKSTATFATRYGTETAGGPSLAFVGGDFWLAFKDPGQDTITYMRSDSPYSWWIAGYEGGHFPIVEGPTFAFKHGGEAALFFAVSD